MRALVTLLVILAAGGLYLLVSGGEQGARDGDLAVRDGDAQPQADGPSLEVSAQGPGRKQGAPAPVPAEGGKEQPAHRVGGRVAGLVAGEHQEVRVRVHVLKEYDWVDDEVAPAHGRLGADGRFAVDVTALRAARPDARRVQVSVDHPAYVVALARVVLAPPRDAETRVPEPIVMERAIVVPGRVVDEGGEGLVGATVVLVAMRDGEPVVSELFEARRLDAVRAGPDGRFALRTAQAGEALLVGWAEGRSVAGRRLAIARDAVVDEQTVTLGPGYRVTGRARLHGRALAGATVAARPKIEGAETELPGVPAVWAAGRIIATGAQARTDPNGWFEIAGLERGTRELQIVALEGPMLAHRVTRDSRVDVEVPALGVELEFEPAVLEVQVVSGAAPVAAAHATIAKGGRDITLESDEKGRVRVLLPADTPFTLTVSHPRHQTVTRELAAVQRGGGWREVVDVGARTAGATLVVRLVDAAGKPVTRAGFHLRPRGGDGLPRPFDRGEGTHDAADGVYRLEELEPGEVLLLVTPGRTSHAVRGRYQLLRVPVVLVNGRETIVKLTAKLGARVTLLVRDADGQAIDCGATLFDEQGRKVPVRYVWTEEAMASVSGTGPGPGETLLDPPLAPGTYEIECTGENDVSVRVSFTVQAGEARRVEVRLPTR